MVDWISDYIFNPIRFFDRLLKIEISWLPILLGLLFCLIFHIVGLLTLTDKILKQFNIAMDESNIGYHLQPSVAYGVSILSSINIFFILFLYIPFLICIDIIFRDGEKYSDFIKISLTSFYSMIPYLLLVQILAVIFQPENLPIPLEKTPEAIKDWSWEASKYIHIKLIPVLIRNLEYFFYIWILTLITVAYKTFSNQSIKFCALAGTIFIVMIIMIGSTL